VEPICNRLQAGWEPCRIRHNHSGDRVAGNLPTVVDVHVRVPLGCQSRRLEREGNLPNSSLINVAMIKVPRVEPHRWRQRNPNRRTLQSIGEADWVVAATTCSAWVTLIINGPETS
jgi:hypothetical protein